MVIIGGLKGGRLALITMKGWLKSDPLGELLAERTVKSLG